MHATRTPPTDLAATEFVATLAGLRWSWENPDGSHSVIGELEDGRLVKGEVEGKGDLLAGQTYRWLGRWREHDKHGWQFAFDAALAEVPNDPQGAADYLERFADGVGRVTATRLVAAYGYDAVRILTEEPERAVRDGHATEAVALVAQSSLQRLHADPAIRAAHLDLATLLRGQGFYQKAVRAALRLWRGMAAVQVRRDPFLMLTSGLPGCGFLKCDRLYLHLGLPPRRLKRQSLAAWYALANADGDTWTEAGKALQAVREQIGAADPRERRAVALLCRARLASAVTDDAGKTWIAERHKATSERLVAIKLQELQAHEARWPALDDPSFAALSEHQKGELEKALTSPVALLTGNPGTGKTFVAAALIGALLQSHGSAKVAVCAPTGKAAVRISEKLADAGLMIQATTIHRLLGVAPNADGWGFQHGEGCPLSQRFVIVDETSMMDVGLAASLLAACSPGTNVLFVGDVHQLPPVGHGAFLRDMIAAGVSCARLSEIRRNAGTIVRVCAKIKDGLLPKLPDALNSYPAENLVHLVPGGRDPKERQQALEERLDSIYRWLPTAGEWDPVDEVQVIVARNATRSLLNSRLQQALNAAGERGPSGVWRTGDKVICLRNGFAIGVEDRRFEKVYVANGDIGRVKGFRGRQMIVRLSSPERTVAVPLGKKAEDDSKQMAENLTGSSDNPASSWDLAYAVTCHKYQGSECPVVIVLAEAAGRLASREWLYTALSRARQLCVVVGERADLVRATKTVTLPDRKTFLVELLKGEMP